MTKTTTVHDALNTPRFFDTNFVQIQTVNGTQQVIRINRTAHGPELLTVSMPYPCNHNDTLYYVAR